MNIPHWTSGAVQDTGRWISRRAFMRGASVAGLAAWAPAVAACSGPSGTQNGTPATATGALAYNAQKFDPALVSDVFGVTVGWHIFEGLVDMDPVTRELRPGLATEPPRSRGNSVTVRLRDGATFHDGSPVKATDVVYSFRRVLAEETNSFYRRFISFIDDVSAKDEKTVEFQLAYPTNLLANRLAMIAIVPEAAVHADAEKFAINPVGSGPYSFADLQPNDHVTLQRFEGYAGPKHAKLDEITFRVMIEGSSRIAALRSSQVAAMAELPYRDAKSLSEAPEVRIAMKDEKIFNQTIMMLHCGKPPFDDTRVRQALLWAIDRESIARTVFGGNCEIATSVLPRGHPAYSRPSLVYSHDPARARSLLAAAGYPNGLDVELQVNDVSWIAPQGPLLQQQLNEAGIRVKLKVGQSAKLFSNVTAGNYQAFLTSTDPSVFGYDADTLLRWVYYGTLPEQFMYWQGPAQKRVSELLDEAARATDSSRQQQLWAEVQNIAAEEAPAMTLHIRHQPTAWREQLAGSQALPTTGLSFLGASVG